MKLTKLERAFLETTASDLRRAANKLTNIPWHMQNVEGKDNTKEYQQANVRQVMSNLEEILNDLKQMDQVLHINTKEEK